MPWLMLARSAAPYVICFALGFGGAWTMQGFRVSALKNDVRAEVQKLTDYRQSVENAKIAAEKEAEKRRKETANEYQTKLDKLAQDHEIYRRCVAAGKCGARIVRLPNLPDGSGIRVPPPGGTDAVGPNAVPAAGEVAAEDGILKDCARTTLQLNQLQEDIEKQWSR